MNPIKVGAGIRSARCGLASFLSLKTDCNGTGDALAVINGRIRFMARPVTPDLMEGRKSLCRCLSLEPVIICPGHREPFAKRVTEACSEVSEYLDAGGRWPVLG